MKITIIQVGKTKASSSREIEQEYLKRLKPYAAINVITLKEASTGSSANPASRELSRQKEGLEILKHIPKDSFIIALDEHGKSMDSVEFARFIGRKRDFEGANVTFLIGGPYGLSQSILTKTNLRLSFSSLTFTHEIIRILLLEQLYRAFSILAGKTYHY